MNSAGPQTHYHACLSCMITCSETHLTEFISLLQTLFEIKMLQKYLQFSVNMKTRVYKHCCVKEDRPILLILYSVIYSLCKQRYKLYRNNTAIRNNIYIYGNVTVVCTCYKKHVQLLPEIMTVAAQFSLVFIKSCFAHSPCIINYRSNIHQFLPAIDHKSLT